MKITVVSFALLVSFISFGQSYNLDTTFGDGGRLVDSSVGNVPVNVFFENNNYFLIYNRNTIECRNYNGYKNSSFADNGILHLNGPNQEMEIKGSKLINGYIYVFGKISFSSSSPTDDLFILKVSTSGVPDSNFGVNGLVRQDFGGFETLYDILILSDGKIMGIGTKGSNSRSDMVLTKYYSDGTVDTTFDITGYKILTANANESSTGSNLFSFENNILAVVKSTSSIGQNLVLMKIDAGGNYISTFGTNGIKQSQLGSASETGSYRVYDASLIGNDLYFKVFYAWSFTTQFNTLKKYNIVSNTKTDVCFLPYSYPFYAIDNQNIYITGTDRCSPTTSSNCSRDFNLYRKTTAGVVDPLFNGNGTYSYNFFPSDLISDDRSSVFYLHSDGKIFMAGFGYNPYSTGGTGLEMLRITDGALGNFDIQPNNLFSIFPNPSASEITIVNKGTEPIESIVVYDLAGKLIVRESENTSSLKVNYLEKGVYVIKIETENHSSILKLVKN